MLSILGFGVSMTPAEDTPTRRIGRFELQGEIGRGGIGKVFRAFDPKVGRIVAIKVLESDSQISNIGRFRNEATAAGNLHHENIVTIHEFGEDQGIQYLVMEYLEGQDLQKVLKTQTPLSILQKVTIMSQVADGLECAHNSGVLHRDVKPANIMLLADGSVKIMDFGIARLVRESATRLTQKGYLIGTVLYMAPEQLLEAEVDVLCDIWSYGVIYYELLSGKNPFETGNLHSEMYRITHEDPPPLTSDQCPDALQPVIRRLLSKERELRFQSFEDVKFDTEPILIELRKQEAQRLLGQAQDLTAQGDWEGAQPVVRTILELDPQNHPARNLRERIQREILQHAVKPKVEGLVRRGSEEAERRHFAEAIEILESAHRLDGSNEKIQVRLEELRAAKQRNDHAQQCIANSRQELAQNRFSKALEHAAEASRIDPEHPEAAQLLNQIQLEIQELEGEQAIQAGLHKSRGLIAIESFDQAVALLTELDASHPGRSEIKDLMARAVTQRDEYGRRRRFAAGLESAKELLKTGDFVEAFRVLENLSVEFPDEPELSDLQAYVHQELKTKERVQAVEALSLQVASLTQSHGYDEALAAIQNVLQTYPDELILSRLLRSVLSGKQVYQKERAHEEGLQRIRGLWQKGEWEEALREVSSLLNQNPNDPELLTHHRQLIEERKKQERAAALLRNFEGARALLSQGRTSEAVELLRTALGTYPDDPELIDLLRRAEEAEKRGFVASQLAAVAEFESRQDWPAALESVRIALEKYPDAGELFEAEQRILAATAHAERAHKVAAEELAIENDLQARKWNAAFARIQAAREIYPEDDVFRRLAEKAQLLRSQEVATLLQEAHKSLVAGQLDEAEKALRTELQPHAAEPAVRVFAEELAFEKLRREEVQRREVEKRKDIAAQLAAIGEYEQNQNWPAALEVVRKALHKHPHSSDLLAAQARIAASIQQLERDRQIAAEADSIERILKSGDWCTAMARIQQASVEYSNEAAFSQLLKEAQKQKSQDLNALLGTARQLVAAGDLDAADSTLQAGETRLSEDSEFKSLLAEIALRRGRRDRLVRVQQEKQIYIAGKLTRAAEHEARAERPQAAELIRKALQRYPADPALLEELQRLEDALRRVELDRRISAQVKAIERALEKGKWDAALNQVRKAETDFAGAPVFPQLRRQAEEKRQEEIEGLVAQARASLAAGELEPAEAALRKPLQPYAQEPLVTALANDIASERFCSEREASARKQIAARRFDEASRSIQEIAARWPNRAVIFELQTALSEEQQCEQQEALYREGQDEAERLLGAGQYDDAIERYSSLLADFPGDAKLAEALEAAKKARDGQELRRKLEAEIGRIEELKRNRSAREVRDAALMLLKEEENHQVRDLLKWAEEALAVPAPVESGTGHFTQIPQPQPPAAKEARGAPVARIGLHSLLAGLAGLFATVVILTIVYFRGTTPFKVEPATLEFSYQIGGPPVSPKLLSFTGARSTPVVHSNQSWLDASTDPKALPSNARVQVHPGNLTKGDYDGKLTILAGRNSSERQIVRVKLTITEPARKKNRAASIAPIPPGGPEGCIEPSDESKYGGIHHGILTWISDGEPATRVTIQAALASKGRVIGDHFPNFRAHVTLPEGVNLVLEPTHCNGRTLVFDNPAGLARIEIRWEVY